MLEKATRQPRANSDFESQYDTLCYLADLAPLRSVKNSLGADGALDLNGDQLRIHDWAPLLDAFKTNKNLTSIAIRSSFKSENDDFDASHGQNPSERIPPVRSRDITYRLALSLKDCMTVSNALSVIRLQGIPLRERDLILLGKGLHDNHSVTFLSLEGCGVGDKGVEIVCANVRNLRNLKILNFSNCGVSCVGAETLSELVRHQSLRRHNDAWRDSLRYRRPDLDVMSGIRRLTLNGNGLIGDEGVRILAETLKDDLWIKALDMQRCGVTTFGAKVVLDVVKYNTSIVVLDLRRNPAIDSDVLRNVMEHVLINANGKDQEFQWLSTTDPQAPTMGTTRGAAGRTRPDAARVKQKDRRASSRDSKGAPRVAEALIVPVPPPPPPPFEHGVPHHSAERAMRHGCSSRLHHKFPQHHAVNHEKNQGYSHEYVVDIGANGEPNQIHHQPNLGRAVQFSAQDELFSRSSGSEGLPVAKGSDEGRDLVAVGPPKPPRQGWVSSGTDEANGQPHPLGGVDAGELKKLRVDFEQCWRHLQEETKARRQAEERIVELTLENSKLQRVVEDLEEKANSVLDDDAILDSIEATFTKFHSFLDLLKEVGLGQLISYAGIEIPPPVTPNQSVVLGSDRVGDASFVNGVPATPVVAKMQLNVSETTRNFMSEQVSRILQESVMKQPPLARHGSHHVHHDTSFSPAPSTVDASLELPGFNYRDKMIFPRPSGAATARRRPLSGLGEDSAARSGFHPMVTSSRVWATPDAANSSLELLSRDPILARGNDLDVEGSLIHSDQNKDEDLYESLLRRAQEATGYPYAPALSDHLVGTRERDDECGFLAASNADETALTPHLAAPKEFGDVEADGGAGSSLDADKSPSAEETPKKEGENTVLSMPELEEYKMEEARRNKLENASQMLEELPKRTDNGKNAHGISTDLQEFRERFASDIIEHSKSAESTNCLGKSSPASSPHPKDDVIIRSPPEFADDDDDDDKENHERHDLNSFLTNAKEALRKTSKLQELLEENRVIVPERSGESLASEVTSGAVASLAELDDLSASPLSVDEDNGDRTKSRKASSSVADLEEILSDPDFNENYPKF